VGFLNGDEKMGMCQFEVDPITNIADVSINLNPDHRNKRLSTTLLSQSIATFLTERPTNLRARIKKTNIGSITCFLRIGFVFERYDNGINYYTYSVPPIKLIESPL